MKKHFNFSLAFWGLGVFASGVMAATSETKINFCNNTDEKIFISVAYQPSESAALMARGWWGLDAKSCSDNSFPISGDKILVHAQSSSQIYHWLGTTPLCVNTVDAYDLENAAIISCNEPGQEQRNFKELSLAELTAAAHGEMPKVEFNPGDATRVGGGLKFCNDTTEPVYISFAQKKASDAKTTVNGWFMAKPGQCFEADRDEKMNEVLYFANSQSGVRKWKGNVPLCTNDYDGYSHADAGTMDCSTNNLRLQNFTKEKLPSSGEFTHHFKTSDAVEARSVVDVCNSQSEESAIAIAFKDPEFDQVVSRGWYVLKSGECAKEQVIDAEEVLLHIEKADRTVLLEGEIEACVNNEKAFQFSQATKMACTGTDELKVKFAPKAIEAGKVRIDVP